MTIHRIPFTFTSPQGVEAARLAIVDTDKLRGMAYACLNNKTKRSVEAGGALVVTFDDGRRTVEPGLTAGIRPAIQEPAPIALHRDSATRPGIHLIVDDAGRTVASFVDLSTCAGAALDIMEWLRSRGIPATIANAVEGV